MEPLAPEQPLSRTKRRIVFLSTIFIFVVSVPTLAFYAAGYRLDLENDKQNIKTVGGMYISSVAEEIEIYVDDEPVEDMRIFQQAAYVQNLDAGLHQVHVQGEGLQTWVKDLPVHAHLVTESASFNMPDRPQIRIIPKYLTAQAESVVPVFATATFAFASSTNQFYATTSKATSSYSLNTEFNFVSTLFASSSKTKELLETQMLQKEKPAFSFSSATTSTSSPELATTTKIFRDVVLREEGEEIIAFWSGEERDQPYYYCVTNLGASTSYAYGAHVYEDLVSEYASSTVTFANKETGSIVCRESIRIDRLWQDVQWFDFYPNSRDLVLILLPDGLYVGEIDDRAWQNTQLLYPGENLTALRNGNQILINDGDYYLEVFTELQN